MSPNTAIPWEMPSQCASQQFFNPVSMKCSACPDGKVSDQFKESCKCAPDTVPNPPSSSSSVNLGCSRCGQGMGVNPTLQLCVYCEPQSEGQCLPCGEGEVPVLLAEGANNSFVQKCTKCPTNMVPDADKQLCVPCTDSDCFCKQNLALCSPTSNSDAKSEGILLESGQMFRFSYLNKYFAIAEAKCRAGDSRECQHLANMCVLQDFNQDSQQGACYVLETIRRATLNLQQTIPALFYSNEASIELYRENGIEATFNVDDTAVNSQLDLLTASYSLSGTFLGVMSVRSGLLQICPQIYPLPVLNENIRDNEGFVNRNSELWRDSRWVLTRRFFIGDIQLGSQTSQEYGQLVRLPQTISIHIQLQSSRDGRIFPPVGELDPTNKSSENVFTSSFSVQYSVDSSRYDKTIEVLMATFCSMSVLLAALKAYSWGRRAGKLIVDASTIVKFLFYTCENISNVFLFVIGFISIWINFAYKLQQHLVYLPLSYNQEWSFVAYIISATSLKFVVLIHNYVALTLVETFFIDWERSRITVERPRDPTLDVSAEGLEANPTVSANQKASKQAPVVIWRTYLIANEWNELQGYRKTSLTVQMLSLLLLLDYFSFADYAKIQPGFDRYNQPREYSETRMSRFAVDISFYLFIGLLQWLFQVLIIEKVADPFHNFMDLCSVANISVLAMTHPLRGYYIHGRSVHGLADTDMFEMNTFLQRERENLCGLRGLQNGSEIQTFVVHMPRAFRDRLHQLTTSLRTASQAVNLRQTGLDKNTAKVENTAKVYGEINQFLKDMIDHVDVECDYVVTDAKLIEEVMGLELTDTTKLGVFVRDPSEIAYSMAFLYGNEWIYMSFEMLFFCLIDLLTHSRTLAAALTYLVSTLLKKTAKIFFTNNLIKSSLVDHRFLI
uniref:Meckelin n=1 Tax=Ditylenchus dipsaci TaxID=166011 RepID=A0A915CPX8_9BILA